MKIWSTVSQSRAFAWSPTLLLLAAGMVLLAGCSSLLPTSKEETVAAWNHFDEAKSAFDKIIPGQSRAELKALGFDVVSSPNVQVLSYLDIAEKTAAIPVTELEAGLQECLRARNECQAYVFELRRLRGKRVGSFWPDFLNFQRTTDSTGWRFNALLVMVNDKVTYKLWSGTPKIATSKDERNPLGPLQGSGSSLAASLMPW